MWTTQDALETVERWLNGSHSGQLTLRRTTTGITLDLDLRAQNSMPTPDPEVVEAAKTLLEGKKRGTLKIKKTNKGMSWSLYYREGGAAR